MSSKWTLGGATALSGRTCRARSEEDLRARRARAAEKREQVMDLIADDWAIEDIAEQVGVELRLVRHIIDRAAADLGEEPPIA